MTNLTLPTDSAERKEVPMFSGCFAYFPAALAGVARHSKMGNDKHNPGEPMHHARGKSMDHEDCILRHLMDLSDLRSILERTGGHGLEGGTAQDDILEEANALAWRALALSQELHEKHGGAPLAPGAKLPGPEEEQCYCDSRGLGDPEKSCGDCPTKDYPDLIEKDRPVTAPFDLDKALLGHPLVTRDGRWALNFRDSLPYNFNYPYTADVFGPGGKEEKSYGRNGRYYAGNTDDPRDLLLDLRYRTARRSDV